MSTKETRKPNSGGLPLLSEALTGTGFEKCEFGPDNDPCKKCGKTKVQLYFGNRDYWDSREGDYWCAECLIELHQDNEAVSVLGGTVRENPDG